MCQSWESKWKGKGELTFIESRPVRHFNIPVLQRKKVKVREYHAQEHSSKPWFKPVVQVSNTRGSSFQTIAKDWSSLRNNLAFAREYVEVSRIVSRSWEMDLSLALPLFHPFSTFMCCGPWPLEPALSGLLPFAWHLGLANGRCQEKRPRWPS